MCAHEWMEQVGEHRELVRKIERDHTALTGKMNFCLGKLEK